MASATTVSPNAGAIVFSTRSSSCAFDNAKQEASPRGSQSIDDSEAECSARSRSTPTTTTRITDHPSTVDTVLNLRQIDHPIDGDKVIWDEFRLQPRTYSP